LHGYPFVTLNDCQCSVAHVV